MINNGRKRGYGILAQEYDEETFNKIKNSYFIQKLTYKDKNETLHETDTYYEVPVIRTIDNLGGYNFRDINTTSDRYEFG